MKPKKSVSKKKTPAPTVTAFERWRQMLPTEREVRAAAYVDGEGVSHAAVKWEAAPHLGFIPCTIIFDVRDVERVRQMSPGGETKTSTEDAVRVLSDALGAAVSARRKRVVARVENSVRRAKTESARRAARTAAAAARNYARLTRRTVEFMAGLRRQAGRNELGVPVQGIKVPFGGCCAKRSKSRR